MIPVGISLNKREALREGSRVIRFIRENGGMVMVQQPASALFNGMPLMAISTGAADFILAPEDIGPQLIQYIENPHTTLEPMEIFID